MIAALSIGELSWKELGKRVWAEVQEDEVTGRAAQLSYYFLLALFPALLFLTSLLGYFAGEDSELRVNLFRYLSAVLPGEATEIISKTVTEVTQNSGGGKLSFGILATVWAASNGMGAISESLNIAYDVKETRPWWKTRLVAVGLTLALSLLIITALVLVLYGHDLAEMVAGKFGLGEAFEWTWKIAQWPVVLAFVALAFALIYYFAPDLEDPEWKWITPGSLIAVGLWLLVSFAFKTYLSFFNSYSATYGSLGAVIILMLWFYFTGMAILIGGEINSEIEHAAAELGHPDAKEKGEKAPGDREGATGSKGSRTPALTTTKGSEKSRAKGSPTRAPRAGGAAAAQKRSFSLGKLAVVLGAWALSKVGRGSTERKTR
ncbi:MAG TPA: YihY/virulence factor BrkB family protein [Pyrinomonadaceae bacterium]|nr:YihY/virulence factor BrkB family protein [Pyrinomonadaceae bacterium]